MSEEFGNIPRMYTALAQCLAAFVYVPILKSRWKKERLMVFTLLFVCLQALLLVPTGGIGGILWIVIMLLSIGNMLLYLYFVCQKDFSLILYCGLKAFLLSEFSASLEWQLSRHLSLYYRLSLWGHLILLFAVYGLIACLVYRLESRTFAGRSLYALSPSELLSASLIVLAAFFLSNLSFVFSDTPFSSDMEKEVMNIRTLVDFGGLGILFAYQSRIMELHSEKELLAIQGMLQSQYAKFRNYQESIDMVNIKYHDLKHQISALKSEADTRKRNAWIESLEKELEEYKPKKLTGNSVLDALIDAKSLQMEKHKVKFTIVAEGALLDFMHVTDICSIFGNALDNALEAVILIPEEEKRLIHLSLSRKKGFVLLEVLNYFAFAPKMREGILESLKSDRKNHGFGIKSMRYAVEKYGGTLHHETEDSCFKLRIMIPISM